MLSAGSIAVYWGVLLAGDIPFRQTAHPELILWLFEPVLSAGAFAVMVKWVWSRAPNSSRCRRLFHTFGLYAYGVYYLHPLVLLLLSSFLGRFSLLHPDAAPFYAIVLPSCCLFSLYAAKTLAKFPFGRYLT